MKFEKSVSLNLMAGAFIPIHFDEKYYTAPGFSIGIHNNISKLISLCLDYDLIFTKAAASYYYYNPIKRRYIMRLEFGPQFHFYNYKDFSLFATTQLGIMTIQDEKNGYEYTSLLPVCFSIETGFLYRLSNKVSLVSKIKHNSYSGVGLEKGDIFTFLQINSGINIRL